MWLSLLLAFALSSVVCLTGCSPAVEQELKVGTNVWLGYEPGYIAEAEGLYASTRVSMRQFSSATEVMRAFRNKLIDVAALTMDEALQLAQYDEDVAIILVADISDGADVIMARPEIESVSDLAGKRVAVEGTALGAFVIARAMEKHGVDPEAVDVVAFTVDESLLAYNNNQIDAVVTFEPYRTKLLRAGAIEIFNSKQMPNEIVDVLVSRKSTILAQQDSMRGFLQGWLDAVDLIHHAPEKVNPIIARRLEISLEEATQAYEGLVLPDLAANQSLLTGPNATLIPTAMALNNLLLDKGLLEKAVAVEQLFSEELVKDL